MSSRKIGPALVGLKMHNDVAILWSRDSANAIGFMPFTSAAFPRGAGLAERDGYVSLVQQMHHSLYEMNVGADFVFPETQGFLRIQAADCAGAVHLRRCIAPTYLRLREEPAATSS